MNMASGGLLIGELARQAGVRITTVRFYERRGLLPEPERAASGYRYYSDTAVERLRFIQRAKVLGFSLQEIAELLSLSRNPEAGCEEVRQRAAAKMVAVETRIERLQRIRSALGQLMAQCPGEGSTQDCPLLNALNDDAKG